MTLSELNSTFESMFSLLTSLVQGGKTLWSAVPTEAKYSLNMLALSTSLTMALYYIFKIKIKIKQ